MKTATRISPGLASSLLVLVLVVSALLLVYSRAMGNTLLQVLAMLASMVMVFYLSHPLGHFLTGMALGARTDYFFVGKSDFRKLSMKPMSLAGGLMPTIGTKLNKESLSKLTSRRRGYIFGAGVIVSNTLVGVELVYVLVAGFSIPAILLAVLFFFATVMTEAMFSTKVGDLGKMRAEFNKQTLKTGTSHSP